MEKFHEGEKERDNRDRSPTSVINSKEWCTIVARLSRWILSRERCRRRRRNEQSRDKVNENRMERFLIQSVICEHETPPTESEGNIRSQFWMFSFGEGGVIKLATPVLSPLSASILIRCLNSVLLTDNLVPLSSLKCKCDMTERSSDQLDQIDNEEKLSISFLNETCT